MEILTVKNSHSLFLLDESIFNLLLSNYLKDTKHSTSLVKTSFPKKSKSKRCKIATGLVDFIDQEPLIAMAYFES